MCSALPLCPVSIKDQKVSESIRKKYLHIVFWRWCKANEGKEKETVVVFIVAVKCFSVLTSKEETLSPQWEIFIFHWRAQWAHLLLISCTFSDRSEAAHSHTSGLSKPQLLYKEHLYYSSWVCVCVWGGVQCITQWAQWHWQSPSWGKSGSTLHRDSQIPKQPAYLCTTPDKSGELFDAALWCQLLHYFYYWHSTG